MIVDIPEGLPVSMVSSPPTFVLEWNSDEKIFLAMVFDIGSSLVHDNGVLLLFVEGKSIKTNPSYFSSGRFFLGEKGKAFIISTIEVTCKGLKGFSLIF
jgi:hypothetical protein